MYNSKYHSKIKNAKILPWHIEPSQYLYEIAYRAGKYRMAPDTLSRVCCATLSRLSLYNIHSAMCHPGITRMYHYVRSRNLPYSLDDVRQMTSRCKVSSEIKPTFLKPYMSLEKATQPM